MNIINLLTNLFNRRVEPTNIHDTVNKTEFEILFDYKQDNHRGIYISRCKPILDKMLARGIIDDFINIISDKNYDIIVKRGLKPIHFTNYDYNHICECKDFLLKIKLDPTKIIIDNYDDIDNINKIMMKQYLLDPFIGTNKRVSIQVYFENTSYQLKIVSYGSRNNTNYQDPGGTINNGETALDAAKRELKEELGIIVEHNRLIQLNEFIFKVILDKNEKDNYIKNINNLYIDPEITMIIIV